MSIDSDLAAMATDTVFTVPIVFGAQNTRGWYDVSVGTRNDEPYMSSSRAGRTESVRVPAAALVGLGIEKDITVGGRKYRIVDVGEEEDGKMLRLDLQRV